MDSREIIIPRKLASRVLEQLYELRCERDWWKDEPRLRYRMDFKLLCDEIDQMEALLGRERTISYFKIGSM